MRTFLVLIIVGALSSCVEEKPCRPGSVFLSFVLPAEIELPTTLNVVVSLRSKETTTPVATSNREGSIEVEFPSGYPVGDELTVTINLSSGPSFTKSVTKILSASCDVIAIDFAASEDLRLDDQSTPDQAASADQSSDDLGMSDGGSVGPIVLPGAARVTRGKSQVFASDVAVAWALVEPSAGALTNATATSVTFVAGMTPGEYHLTATGIGGAVTEVVITVTDSELTLLAGALGGGGNLDGMGPNARFLGTNDISYSYAVGSEPELYVTENGAVRLVAADSGIVLRLVGEPGTSGYVDDIGTAARFSIPKGTIKVDANTLLIVDYFNSVIRRVNLSSRAVDTIVGDGSTSHMDGTSTAARLCRPKGIARLDIDHVLFTDTCSHTIRKLQLSNFAVTTVAGVPNTAGSVNGGLLGQATFAGPASIAGAGDVFYVADFSNYCIRKIDFGVAAPGVTTLAGSCGAKGAADGMGEQARLSNPEGLAFDGTQYLYVSDSENHAIRRIDVSNGDVTTFAGTLGIAGNVDAIGASARFDRPQGLTYGLLNGAPTLFVTGTSVVRKIDINSGQVSLLAGSYPVFGSADGQGANARFLGTPRLALGDAGNVFLVDRYNHTIRQISSTGVVTTLAGSAGVRGSDDGVGSLASFSEPSHAIFVDGSLYVTDGKGTIRKIVVSTGDVSTIAGVPTLGPSVDGDGLAARFNVPHAIIRGPGNTLLIADSHGAIRSLDLTAGANYAVTTVAGVLNMSGTDDGPAGTGKLNVPLGLAYDGVRYVYVTEEFTEGRLRRVDLMPGGTQGTIDTLIDNGVGVTNGSFSTAQLGASMGDLALDGADRLYVADTSNALIRNVSLSGLTVSTLAGVPNQRAVKLGPLPARLNGPNGLVRLPDGDLLVSDEGALLRVSLAP